jgi:hypothetical protein
VVNSRRILGSPEVDDIPDADLEQMRTQMAMRGLPADDVSVDQLRQLVKMMVEGFRDSAPLTGAEAATIILEGVRAERWRILVGDDAKAQDARVRADPEGAYDHGSTDFGTALLGARPDDPPL